MRRDFVVFACKEFLRVVFLHISKVSVETKTLLKVPVGFLASNVPFIICKSKNVNACLHDSMPMNALKFDVCIVFLKSKV